tara:strand:+ start:184 stop:1644 length:1461 start_codon:yes stop_codon:yes gene_type:complete
MLILHCHAEVTKNPKTKPLSDIEHAQQQIKKYQNFIVSAKQHQQNIVQIKKNTDQLEKTDRRFDYNSIIKLLPKENDTPTAAQMVIQHLQLKTVDRDVKKALALTQHCFSLKLPPVTPCNQLFSGRCWMFAGLNILRPYFIKKYKLKPDFELSQSYLFFWHYFEQYTTMMNLFFYESLKGEEKAMYLEKPLHDGGNWFTFRRLVTKYGIVPKHTDGETWPSSHSSEMNSILCALLQKDLKEIQNMKLNEFKTYRSDSLKKVLKILCLCMGHPPTGPITLVYDTPKCDKVSFTTPLAMFQEADKQYHISQHVQLIIDPRHTTNAWYTTQHQHLRGIPELLFNVDEEKNETIVKYITTSLSNGMGVWFACNMSINVSSVLQGMDKGLYRPDIFIGVDLEMNKKDRMEWGRARCNHAMLISGVLEENGVVTAFQIQNSWGAGGPHQGYYKMTREWFDEYVHTIVFHDSILGPLPQPDNPKELEYYDFFG